MCVRFFKQTSQNRISLSALQAIESRRTLTWLLQQSARVGRGIKKCIGTRRNSPTKAIISPSVAHATAATETWFGMRRTKSVNAWQPTWNQQAESSSSLAVCKKWKLQKEKTGGGKTFASTLNLIVLRQGGQSGFCGWLGFSIIWVCHFSQLIRQKLLRSCF